MSKLIARWCFISVFLLSLAGTGAAASSSLAFSDVPENHPHYHAIKHLKEAEIVSGTSVDTFDPNGLVNRATGLKMMLRGLELYNPDQDPAGFDIMEPVGLSFSDITEKAWFVPYVRYAVGQDILKGYPDGTFQAGRELNLAEVLKILVNGYDQATVKAIDISENPYTDVPQDAWFARYFQFARDHNLIKADDNYAVNPAQKVTRAQLAELIYRFRMMSLNKWKVYDPAQHWQKKSFPFVRSALKIPHSWKVSQNTDHLAIWKPDSQFDQQHYLRVYPRSARITLHLEKSQLDSSAYFEMTKKSYSTAEFEQKKNMLEASGRAFYHRYQFIGDDTFLVILTDTGGEAISAQDLVYALAALSSHEVIAAPPREQKNNDVLLSELRELIHVDGKGKSIINQIADARIVHTDTIGVGTGPVDYYYSESLDYTIKYERSFDVILDLRKGNTTNF